MKPMPSQITAESLQRYADRMNAAAALKHYGVSISFPDSSRVALHVGAIPAPMRGGMGDAAVVNGGVLSALCDLAIGSAAALVDPARRAATVQLSIRFEQALRGDSIRGEAYVDRATGRLVFASAVIMDEAGHPCVRCQGIVSLLGAPSV